MAKLWVVDRLAKVGTSAVPKVGSTAIKRQVPNAVFRDSDDLVGITKRVAWIRNPHKRLASAYKFFKGQKEEGADNRYDMPTNTWEDFVDYALKVENRHWDCQKDVFVHDGVWVPTHTYKFEHIGLLFPKIFGVKLERQNGSNDYPIDWDYREEDIRDNWSDDFNLWESL